jgi:hypothetical protein
MPLLSRLAVQAARAYGILSSKSTNISASYLVVAGGGSGGGKNLGGGGGAGGFLTGTNTLSLLVTYTVTVGAGGASVATANGNNGSNSVLSGTGITTITSTGGGGGGSYSGTAGQNGGSGGGQGGLTGSSTGPGSGTSGQGNNGGNGGNAPGYPGGGGGGAGAVGGNATTTLGGNGGNGSSSSISGSSVTYAGGGGGSAYGDGGGTAGSGGTGGGGAGGTASGTAGTVNTGGGGGGGDRETITSGAGGSGIVIISYASATPRFVGGTLTTSGGNQIHTFTSSGTLSPLTPVTASYLVVAGGGGGGNVGYGGGGGAGGLLTSSTTLYSGATYVVTVGAGGNSATNGSNSVVSGTGLTTITSTGGGAGGSIGAVGSAGGSGGGGGGATTSTQAGGAGTSGQGFAGGSGTGATGTAVGGGGGGASAVGQNAPSSTQGGAGGAGTASSISGTSVTYAGGGGGGHSGGNNGAGGAGGGGAAGAPAVSGTTNLGGGGGGAGNGGAGTNGASGGSGVVIISYAGSQVFNGGLVTSSGGNTIHTFTATGALTPLTNNLTNSLRFRQSASAFLSRTPSVGGNRRTWTASCWYKNGVIDNNQTLFSNATSSDSIGFRTNRVMEIYFGAGSANLVTTQVFRDVSAWYHIVVAVDTTQATAANRIKLYVNGNQVTAFSTATYPSQNYDTSFNQVSIAQNIGRRASGSDLFLDGYMDDIYWVDGEALEPYFFGNNDANGVWKPIQYRGTYGTNGFYLNFSNTTSTTTLGNDSSGNGNNWTTNNISLTAGVTYDAMLDVPTNTSATTANYAVMNPLELGDGAPAALSNGNLTITGSSTLYLRRGTMNFPLTGKYYCEFTVTAVGSGVSIAYDSRGQSGATQFIQYDNGGTKNINGTSTSYGASFTTGDIVAMAVDADGGSIAFYKNNTSQGSITFSSASMTGVNATAMVFAYTSAIVNANFGQRPFSYTPPTGFVALNTFNLPTPTILQGNRFMDATLYTGTGTTQTIVNQGQFSPDFVWVKNRARNDADPFYGVHLLFNTVTGVGNRLMSQSTASEAFSSQSLTAFNSNGFSIGTDVAIGNSGDPFVAWQWDAGSSTVTNTSGSISSQVRANTTSGFSIVTYTGNNTLSTVGHGLGVGPKFIIVKTRSGTDGWIVYHASLGVQYYTFLNTGAASLNNLSNYWGSTAPSSTTFSINAYGGVNTNSATYVAYCWAEIAGFSRFGSYVGNETQNAGPFVYTGFRPEFVLIKNTTNYDWHTFDSTRSPYNYSGCNVLKPNSSAAELTARNDVQIDILSNGFRLIGNDVAINGNGNTHIYMAFAEHPFKNANAR